MALSLAEIEAVVRDLQPKLEGGRLERIDQPDPHKLILTVRNGPGLYWLLLCTHPHFSRIHLLTGRPEQPKPATGFGNVVRQHNTGNLIQSVRQVPGDRVVIIESVERDRLMQPHRVRLIAELVGIGSNLLLVDEAGKVLATLSREGAGRRRVAVGDQYVPLPPPESLPVQAAANRFVEAAASDDPLGLGRAIQATYARLEAEEALAEQRADLLAAVRPALKARRGRLAKVGAALERSENAESIRRQGELLQLALPQVIPGQHEVEVENLFDPARPKVRIALNPTLTPEENIGWLFDQYKKAKRGRERLAVRLDQTRREVAELEALDAQAEQATAAGVLNELASRVRALGLVPPAKRAAPAAATKPAGPRVFCSGDGLEILVARSNRENERLTFTIARGNDYWMHLADWPGPHVVIRKPSNADVPHETFIDAAHLAVYFSKIRGAGRAEVHYTQCKNVRRMKGGTPGRVSYARGSTMPVRIEPARLERLLGSPFAQEAGPGKMGTGAEAPARPEEDNE